MDNNLKETGLGMEHEMEHGMGHRMMDKAVEFRFAESQDVNLILRFIKELVDYEGILDQVVATKELLDQQLFEEEKAEMILGMKDEEIVGFALFFHNFSTFLGRSDTYPEGLCVHPEYRSRGFGTVFSNWLAAITMERGCGRPGRWCLDWNKPSIDLYLGMGVQAMSNWTAYRTDGERLKAMAVTAQRQHVRRP